MLLAPRQTNLGHAYLDLFKPARVKGFYGGRGGGKSQAAVEVAVLMASEKRIRVVCGREFMVSIKESIKALIELKIEALGLSDQFRSTETEIECMTTGSKFMFVGLGRNIASLKGLEDCDIFIGDEAQTFSAASLEYLRPTLRKPGSELWFLWNPHSASDAIESLRTHPPTNSIIKKVSWRDNAYFKISPLHQEMLDLRKADFLKYQHIWEGEFEKLADDRVFRKWEVGVRLVPDTVTPLFGSDFGFSNDPTALVRCYLLDEGKTLYIDRAITRKGVTVDAMPAFYDQIEGIQNYMIVADSSRPELIQLLNSRGFRVTHSIKGRGSIKEGVAWLQSKKILVHPMCKAMIYELENYAYTTDTHGVVLPELAPGFDHCIDALRYAVELKRRPASSIRLVKFG